MNEAGLSLREFEAIRRLAYEKFGLDLKNGKEELVSARLAKKLRECKCGSVQEYYRRVMEDGSGELLTGLIDALTTNHTGFLREAAHFEYLRDHVLPELKRRDRVEIWSAACATGEEPYSIAFLLLDAMGPLAAQTLNILASDISTRALGTAERAVYPDERCRALPPAWYSRFFLRGKGRWRGWRRVRPEVRNCVEFRRLNLIEPFWHARRFPVIFCRNVMIYFDQPTQQKVVRALTEWLEEGGYLFVGHAESLSGIRHDLQYVRPAVYRKAGGPARLRGKGPA